MSNIAYSTVAPFLSDMPLWVPEEHQERVASYNKYDDIYWSRPESLKLAMNDDTMDPLYIPKARTVVDTTAHYWLKGLTITAPEGNAEMTAALEALIARELFISRFHTAKQSGVARGDFMLHITADPDKPEGTRISITSVHPGAYFPVYDDWDPDKLVKIHLAEQFDHRDPVTFQLTTYIRRLTYEYVLVGKHRRVQRTEGFFKEKDWFHPTKAEQVKTLLRTDLLPLPITTIPVYAFPNIEWQGNEFGTSELAGFERLLQGIDQTMTDEEVALALEGLGVYATDAAGPVDDETGLATPWEIAPARVMQVPLGSYFKRVEGISNITPMLEHVKYLQDSLYEASGTSDIARGVVDVQVAESGIALALRFQPTLAKIEQRDNVGVERLKQFWHDWAFWHDAYEGEDFTDQEVQIGLGDKLPEDRAAALNELNNMHDRKVIDSEYYREQMKKLGYVFPDDMQKRIEDEQRRAAELNLEAAQAMAELTQDDEESAGDGDTPAAGKSGVQGRPKRGGEQRRRNKSNNKSRENESRATEARA